MHSNCLIATRLAALEHEVIGSPDAIQSHHAAYTAAQTQSSQQQQQQHQQQQQYRLHSDNVSTSSLTQARSRIDKLEQLAGAAALAKSHEARLKAIEQQLKTQADQWDMDKAQVVLDTWLQRPQSSQQKQQQQQQQSQHTASTTFSFKPANAARLSTRECAAVTLQAWTRHTLKSREKQQENATERTTERAEQSSSDSSLPTPPAVTERSIAGALHVSTRVHAEGSVLEPVRLTSTTTNSTTNSSHDAVVPSLVRSSSAVGTPALLLT
eukprot:21311-Heterococcus_DN1.PRE.2